MPLRCIYIACFLLIVGDVFSQRYPFINYTPIDGLVNNSVKAIRQDSKGRLYFLTKAGMSVYDGARFTNYTSSEGLSLDVVNDILEITPDSFWIAINTGKIHCLVHQRITTLQPADGYCPLVNSFYRSAAGQLYAAGDEGLFIWRNKKFAHLNVTIDNTKGDLFTEIKQVGRFLILLVNPGLGVDPGALYLYDTLTNKAVFKYNKVRSYDLDTDSSGDIWIAGADGISVLKKKDLEQGIFQKCDVPKGFSSIKNTLTGCLKFDRFNRLWVGVPNVGVLLVVPGKTLVSYNESGGLASARINKIFHDKEGNTWFIPEGRGVQKLVNTGIAVLNHPFGEPAVNDLSADPGTDSVWFWVPARKKIILVNGDKKREFMLPKQQSSGTRCLVRGSSAFIYDPNGFKKFEVPLNGNNLKFVCQYNYSSTEPSSGIIDRNGNIIFCTGSTLRVFFKDCTSFLYPLHYFADIVCIDRTGLLWVITRSGKLQVLAFHPEDNAHYLTLKHDFSSYLENGNPRSLVVDENNRVWIGTRYNGLFCYAFEKEKLRSLFHLTRKEGLTDNFINYLGFNRGALWASSPAGLDKIVIVNEQPLVENVTESSKIFESIRKVAFDKSGNVWAHGESGIIIKVTDPGNRVNSEPPTLLLSAIKAGEQTYSGTDSIAPFKYDENNISFFAAAPTFYDEKEVRYSYRLDGGGSRNWSEPATDASFHFINLSPGKYVLHVKADFPAARYPTQFLSYSFSVNPPWWQTWWFRTLLVIGAIALFLAIVRAYYRAKFLKQKMLMEKQQAVDKERTRIATDMHDDLGAGLSRIKYLSQSIQFKKLNDDALSGEVQKIAAYSDEMVEKMGEIVWALNEKNDTIEHLVTFTRAYAADYLESNNIQCTFTTSNAMPDSFLTGEVRRNIFLSVKESLHNVVKHAGAQTVIIRVTVDSHLKFNIHDDGKGINWQQIRPFSNGLSNISKRMEEIGGKAAFQNNGGTEVVLDVPLRE